MLLALLVLIGLSLGLDYPGLGPDAASHDYGYLKTHNVDLIKLTAES